jgi:hypothetical protein
MPVLGTLLVNLFGALSSFLALYFAKRVAVVAAAIAAAGTLLLTLTGAITAALAGIASALPSDSMLMTGFYLAIPSNGPAVLAFVLLVDSSIAVYRLAMDHVRIAAA